MPQEKQENIEKLSDKKPRNLNYYRHLFDAHYITENDINWVLKLREAKKYNNQKLADMPYSVAGKQTENLIQSAKKTNSDLVQNNAQIFEHLTRHRLGPNQQKSLVNFEISLRPGSQDQKLAQLEKKFDAIPFKDKNNFPQSYPKYKEELQLIKEQRLTGKKWIKKSALQNILNKSDGRNHYPQYDIKYKDKNFNNVQHLKSVQLEIGQIKWQNSLR